LGVDTCHWRGGTVTRQKMGRCAGCGYTDALTKTLVHVSKCAKYASAFANGQALRDPAAEYAAHREYIVTDTAVDERAEATGARYANYRTLAANKAAVHQQRWQSGSAVARVLGGTETPVAWREVPVSAVVHDESATGRALDAISNLTF